ncbi:helix-turn-helix domain-containing protein [Streptomyces palmae]|uniref:PucR family transcriptional regulator n=1 Tax=Streptomyces palmae TaxID=1701085 RepID=A0A4Z0HAM4_9ACTN|nr:helix-turn-helix domain-containing protein [Streptomyces palmae]TGB06049.1 PucR family transcriptional regulator [Streptomyces palmae]
MPTLVELAMLPEPTGEPGGAVPEPSAALGPALVEARLRGEREHGRQLARLLEQARDQGTVQERIVRVVRRLAGALGGMATLTTECGQRLAATPEEAVDMLPVNDLTWDVLSGRLAAAAVEDGAWRIRLIAVGGTPPRAVLTLGLHRPFDEHAAALLSQAAQILALLLEIRGAAVEGEQLLRTVSQLRLAVLQLLMTGQVTAAQRTAEGLRPGLLDAEYARVYIVEGPAAERPALAQECGAAISDRALVVPCPAFDSHLIVVCPVRRPVPGAAHEDRAVEEPLRQMVGARPGHYLGGSGVRPIGEAAGAYGEAVRALAVARFQPERSRLYSPRTGLHEVLEPDAWARWAAGVLHPLDTVPYAARDPLLGTVRLALDFPATAAARILGVSRNTVRARTSRAGALLGLDLTEAADRATAHLALRTARRLPAQGPAPTLDALLAATPVVSWARALLRGLDADRRDLRSTLRAWIAANTHVETTADRLGVHVQTVREHLRSAERLLEQQLLAGGGGVHDLVLAFAALEAAGEAPNATGSRRDSGQARKGQR